jgi:hypothetical protein
MLLKLISMGFAMAAVAASDTARVMERIDAMIPVFDIMVVPSIGRKG